jgi:hypothetical protein
VSTSSDGVLHTVLPIADGPHTGLVVYDARDPDTNFAAIEPLRPPEGRPNALRQIDLGENANNPDHLITADERFRIAIALQ